MEATSNSLELDRPIPESLQIPVDMAGFELSPFPSPQPSQILHNSPDLDLMNDPEPMKSSMLIVQRRTARSIVESYELEWHEKFLQMFPDRQEAWFQNPEYDAAKRLDTIEEWFSFLRAILAEIEDQLKSHCAGSLIWEIQEFREMYDAIEEDLVYLRVRIAEVQGIRELVMSADLAHLESAVEWITTKVAEGEEALKEIMEEVRNAADNRIFEEITRLRKKYGKVEENLEANRDLLYVKQAELDKVREEQEDHLGTNLASDSESRGNTPSPDSSPNIPDTLEKPESLLQHACFVSIAKMRLDDAKVVESNHAQKMLEASGDGRTDKVIELLNEYEEILGDVRLKREDLRRMKEARDNAIQLEEDKWAECEYRIEVGMNINDRARKESMENFRNAMGCWRNSVCQEFLEEMEAINARREELKREMKVARENKDMARYPREYEIDRAMETMGNVQLR